MHETLYTDAKGFIDSSKIVTGPITYNGWCFNVNYGICPLRVVCDEKVFDVTVQQRSDVAAFFKCNDIMCGWTITFTEFGIYHLQMEVDGLWNNIFTLSYEDVNCKIRQIQIPSFVVVDNFYENPDSIRKFALKQELIEHPSSHKGRRTNATFLFPGIKERFEEIIGSKIKGWNSIGTNGCFQYCIGGDQLVYHTDLQDYAGVLFLTPDAPPESGTQFYRSKYTKKMKADRKTDEFDITFKGGFLDPSHFDVVDVVGNVYNRLVLFDSRLIHAASSYFGTTKENGRLFQLFFFDLE